jgi:hypothetical protein
VQRGSLDWPARGTTARRGGVATTRNCFSTAFLCSSAASLMYRNTASFDRCCPIPAPAGVPVLLLCKTTAAGRQDAFCSRR